MSAYKSKHDFTASYGMCQTFYDKGYIPEEVLDCDGELSRVEPAAAFTKTLPVLSA